MQARFDNPHERGIRLILAILALAIVAHQAVADEQTADIRTPISADAIEIDGDTLQLKMDRQLHVSGNAVLRKGEQKISGDNIRYDMQNDELQVDGNTVISKGQAIIKGPLLRMRLSENIGEMRDVTIEMHNNTLPPSDQNSSALLSDQAILESDPKRYLEDNQTYSTQTDKLKYDNIRISAKQVLFEGQDVKRLKKASYTSCAANVDDWYIRANDLELNDYSRTGKASNAYVEFKGLPILYTPWMSFSYNNQRKSGFLAPLMGRTSRSGFEVLTPYYINISPDMDATIATRMLSKRGLQLQGELRYLGEAYSGINNIEYLNSDNTTGENRFYGKFTHNQAFNDKWTAGYSIERVSDDKYFSEMATRIVVTSRVNLPQRGFINYSDEHWTFNGLAEGIQNLDDKSFVYQRLPQLSLAYQNTWHGVKTHTAAQMVYFDSLSAAGDVPTGFRSTLYPTLSYPIKTSYGYITPKVGVHASRYQLNNNVLSGSNIEDNQLQRTVPIVSLDTGMYFDRDVQLWDTHYTHTLEPRFFYVYAPYRDQSKIPIFDTSLATLNQDSLFLENQFFGQDRINNANQVSLAMTSRIIDSDTGIERLSGILGQRFYFENQRVVLPGETVNNRRTSDVIAGVTARLSSRLNLDTFWQYDPDKGNIERNNVLLRYNPEPGKSLNIGYRYTASNIEQIDMSTQWPVGRGWYGIGRLNYSIKDDNVVQSLFGLEYDAGCWIGRFVAQRVQTATANTNNAMFFQLELGGLTSIGANPLNIVKRNIPSYMLTNDIPSIYREQNTQ